MLCDAGTLVHDCVRLLALCTGCSGRASCTSWCLLLEHTHSGMHNSCFAYACFVGKPMGSARMHLLLPHVGGMSLKWKSQWALHLQQTPRHATGLDLP